MFNIKNGLLIALSCVTLITACKKGDTPGGDTNTDGPAKLSFTVNGIDNTEAIVNADAAAGEHMAAARNTPIRSTQLVVNKEIRGKDNDLQVNVTSIGLQQDAAGGSAAGTSGAAGKQMVTVGGKQMAVTSPMLSGGKYRIIIYDEAGSSVAVIDGQAGTPVTPVPVSAGKKYTWVAYTYNTTADIPALADNNNPTFNIDVNTLVYVANGSINSTVAGDNKAPLTFKNVLARVKLIVDARGVFAPVFISDIPINNTTAPSFALRSNATGGLYNLKTGTISNLNSAVSRPTRYPATQVNSSTKDSVVAITYAVLPGTVRLPDTVMLWLKNDYDNNYHVYSNLNTFNGQTITAASGNVYNVNMNMIAGYFALDTVKWAKTNLYMVAGNPGYRFRTATYDAHKYPESKTVEGGEFWQSMQLKPLQDAAAITTGPLAIQGDPCTKVKPVNTWKMPTIAQVTASGKLITSRTGDFGFDGSSTTSDAALRTSTLWFPAYGFFQSATRTNMGRGRYWPIRTDTVARAFQVSNTSINNRAVVVPNVGNSSAVYPQYGYNIRCVRAN